jgi:MFS family permease
MADAAVIVEQAAALRWRRAIMAGFGLGGITVSAWGPRLPAVKAELGIGTATIGLLAAGVTMGAIAGLVVSTPLLHRLGSRGGVTVSLLTVAAGMAVMGVALALRSVPLVGLDFLVIGLGIGTLDVVINVEGSAIEQAAGRSLMPLMHGAWSIGAAVGSGTGAACAALGVTPAAQFVGEAVLIAVVSLVMTPAIPAGERKHDVLPGKARADKLRQWLRGWTDWRLLLIGVVMLGVELGEGSANNWLTLAVRDDHGQTAAIAAVFFAAFATGEAVSRIFGGPVVDRLGPVNTIRYTTALGVLGVILFILGSDLWTVLVGVLCWAVGVSMGFPLGMSAAAQSGPDRAARVSVVASIGYFANLAGPPAIGLLAAAVGLLNALWLIVALFIVAFVVSGSLRRPAAPSAALQ